MNRVSEREEGISGAENSPRLIALLDRMIIALIAAILLTLASPFCRMAVQPVHLSTPAVAQTTMSAHAATITPAAGVQPR